MEFGLSLDNLFPYKANACIFSNFPKAVGMTPVKWFSFKPKPIKLTRFVNDLGIVPDISLFPKYNLMSSFDKFDTELGRTPTNWFKAKPNFLSLLQFVNDVKKWILS